MTITGSSISLASVIRRGMGTPAPVIHCLCMSLSDSQFRTARFPYEGTSMSENLRDPMYSTKEPWGMMMTFLSRSSPVRSSKSSKSLYLRISSGLASGNAS